MLTESWQNQYDRSSMKAPSKIVDEVLQYHLEELQVPVEWKISNYLQEPACDYPLNYDQVMDMYMRPLYAEQKWEIQRLQSIIC